MKITIATLQHSHDRGDDLSVHPDGDAARAAIYRDVVAPGWDNITCADGTTCGVHGCTGVSPTIGIYSTDEAVRLYFAHRSEFEHHIITPHEIVLTRPEPGHVEFPELIADVDHVSVTGQLTIAFTDADGVFVTTGTDDPLTYRSKRFRISAHLERGSDGTWAPTGRNGGPYLTYQDGPSGRHAPRTYAAALMAAIIHTIGEQWTPELGAQGRYARATQQLHRITERRNGLLIELEALDAEAAPFWQTVRTHHTPEQP